MLNGKSVLITGGTGSFGQAFVETVLGRANDAIGNRDSITETLKEHVHPSDSAK